MREKSSLRCLSVHYICVTSLEAFQWPSSKLPLNQGKIILSIKITHLFVIEILATKIQGVFFNSLLIFSCLWFQYYLKHNDKDTKFWTECVNREFIILSLFFPLAMFPFIHITIDLLFILPLISYEISFFSSPWLLIHCWFSWWLSMNSEFKQHLLGFLNAFVWTNKRTSASRR